MNDYVLLCDGPKVALTTRSRAYLDDSFWQQFVRDRRLFFWDTDRQGHSSFAKRCSPCLIKANIARDAQRCNIAGDVRIV